MMELFKDPFTQECKRCKNNVEMLYYCPTCVDYDICVECYGKLNAHSHEMYRIEFELEDDDPASYGVAVFHAFNCRDGKCLTEQCQIMKRLGKHARSCVNNECGICKSILNVCCHHAINCNYKACRVLYCNYLQSNIVSTTRETMSEQNLMEYIQNEYRRLKGILGMGYPRNPVRPNVNQMLHRQVNNRLQNPHDPRAWPFHALEHRERNERVHDAYQRLLQNHQPFHNIERHGLGLFQEVAMLRNHWLPYEGHHLPMPHRRRDHPHDLRDFQLRRNRQPQVAAEQPRNGDAEQQGNLFTEMQTYLVTQRRRNLNIEQQLNVYTERRRNLHIETQAHLVPELQGNLNTEQQRNVNTERQRNLHFEMQPYLAPELRENLNAERQRNVNTERRGNLHFEMPPYLVIEQRRNLDIERRRNLDIERRRNLDIERRRNLDIERRRNLDIERRRNLDIEQRRNLDIEQRRNLDTEMQTYLVPDLQGNLNPELRGNLHIETQAHLVPELQGNLNTEQQMYVNTEQRGNLHTGNQRYLVPEHQGNLVPEYLGNLVPEYQGNLNPEHQEILNFTLPGVLYTEPNRTVNTAQPRNVNTTQPRDVETIPRINFVGRPQTAAKPQEHPTDILGEQPRNMLLQIRHEAANEELIQTYQQYDHEMTRREYS